MCLPWLVRAARAYGGALLLAGAAACGSERVNPVGPGEPRTVVGRVHETDAAIAVVSDGDRSTAYLCGGTDTLEWTRWLFGDDTRLDDGGGEGWTVHLDGDGTGGTVQQPGREPAAWSGAVAGGAAGLYTTVDAGCRTGVVVHGDATAQGVWCNKQGYLEQVTPVTPISIEGFLVEVQLASGVRELTVRRFGAAELGDAP